MQFRHPAGDHFRDYVGNDIEQRGEATTEERRVKAEEENKSLCSERTRQAGEEEECYNFFENFILKVICMTDLIQKNDTEGLERMNPFGRVIPPAESIAEEEIEQRVDEVIKLPAAS